MAITSKTAGKLLDMASQAGQIADAIYEHDRQSSDSVRAAAQHLIAAAQRMQEQFARYAASATAD